METKSSLTAKEEMLVQHLVLTLRKHPSSIEKLNDEQLQHLKTLVQELLDLTLKASSLALPSLESHYDESLESDLDDLARISQQAGMYDVVWKENQ